MKIAIVGSREFTDYKLLMSTILSKIMYSDITCVVSGGAKGADKLGEQFADELGIEKLIFKPDWNQYGKRAGYMRNIDIINAADIVFAFWDGVSKGTLHSINLAKSTSKVIHIIQYTKL